MKKFLLVISCVLLTVGAFSYQYQLPQNNNTWEQNHLQPDGNGGFYNHKPGTGMWQDDHITPDGQGGYYKHTPGTGMWQDDHIIPDGQGGLYYYDNN